MRARELCVSVPAAPGQDYPIRIGAGLLEEVCNAPARAGWVLVSDEHVDPLYGDRVAVNLASADVAVCRVVLSAGESSKNMASVGRIHDAALAAGAGRDWGVVALGGGIVGDVAGFAAATLLRGVSLVQVPTSLLAMVDSAVGGKSGVNTAAGKNLVGAFWQPEAVYVDVLTLDTLPDRELRAGLAEVIKYGVILDEQLFVDLEDGLLESCLGRVPEALAVIVERCLRLKAIVVERDERESGPREVLNFGHTVAHAVERATDYEILHGEAVATGMVAEAALGEELGVTETGTAAAIAALCRRAGLPAALPGGLSPDTLVAAARTDKKTRAGRMRCTLPSRIGEVPGEGCAVTVQESALRSVLAGLAAS